MGPCGADATGCSDPVAGLSFVLLLLGLRFMPLDILFIGIVVVLTRIESRWTIFVPFIPRGLPLSGTLLQYAILFARLQIAFTDITLALHTVLLDLLQARNKAIALEIRHAGYGRGLFRDGGLVALAGAAAEAAGALGREGRHTELGFLGCAAHRSSTTYISIIEDVYCRCESLERGHRIAIDLAQRPVELLERYLAVVVQVEPPEAQPHLLLSQLAVDLVHQLAEFVDIQHVVLVEVVFFVNV